MAFTKNKKVDMTARYEKWLTESQGDLYPAIHRGLTMKEIDALARQSS